MTTTAVPFVETSGVCLDLRRSSYPVIGSTAHQLRTLLGMIGPLRDGRRFGAFTDWQIAWRYRHTADSDECRIVEATIDVLAIITAPKWRPPRIAAIGFISAWKAYAAAIEVHEQGHVALAVEAASLLRAQLLALPVQISKAALDAAAQSAANEVLRAAQQRDMSYDRITDHGARQGVVFPSDAAYADEHELRHELSC